MMIILVTSSSLSHRAKIPMALRIRTSGLVTLAGAVTDAADGGDGAKPARAAAPSEA